MGQVKGLEKCGIVILVTKRLVEQQATLRHKNLHFLLQSVRDKTLSKTDVAKA